MNLVRFHSTSSKMFIPVVFILLIMINACGVSPEASTTDQESTAPASVPTVTEVAGTDEESVAATETLAPTEAATAGDAATEEELIIIGGEIAAGLDPVHQLTSSYLRNIGAGEALFRVNADGEVVPSLAQSATQIDPTTWEVALRSNITFWSGATVDAEAVRASLERSRTLDVQAEPFLAGVAIEVIDPVTLHFITDRPNPQMPLNLSYYQLLIHNVESYGNEPNPFDLEVADLTGMYQITAFTPEQVMVLEANAAYWGDQPTIRRIRHEEVVDAQARVLAAQSGQADVVMNIPAEGVAQLESSSDVELVTVSAANTLAVYLNLQSSVLSDERVRQALGWGVDREELNLLASEGLSEPTSSWLASNPAYPNAATQGFTEYDPERAATLLDDAGWQLGDDGVRTKEGQPLQFQLYTWGTERAVGEVLQSQWRELGIVVDVQYVDYGVIQSAYEDGDWDATIEGWGTFGEPQTLLAGQFQPEGRANYGGFDDPTTNELFQQVSETTDEAEYRDLVLQINQRTSELAPIISLMTRPQVTAVNKRLQGFQPHFRQFENVINTNLDITP